MSERKREREREREIKGEKKPKAVINATGGKALSDEIVTMCPQI